MNQLPMARFLRARRAAIQATDVGLPQDGPRRTPGLRREEVAALAHISVSYYARLEQARAARPSSHVIDGLSRALRLDDDQRTLLFTLAGRLPDDDSTKPRSDVTSTVLDLINRMPTSAALVLDAKYDILAWNTLASALFEDFSAMPREKRNLWKALFLGPESPRQDYGLSGDREFARSAASQLRAAAVRYPRDGGIRALIHELRMGSSEFDRLWNAADVISPRYQFKLMAHPVVGPVHLHCNMLMIPDRDQQIVLFTADPGTPSYQALTLLSVIGTQNMTSPDTLSAVQPHRPHD